MRGCVKSSNVALAPIAFVLKRLKIAGDAAASVSVTVSVSALPLYSDTKIDFTKAVVALGAVYSVVTFAVVRSTFAFLYLLDI